MSAWANTGRAMNTSGLTPRPLRRASEHLEDREHRALAAELRFRIGEPGRLGKNGVLWLSIDHSNARDAREGQRKKARGVVAGIPDLMFRRNGRGYARTYWIELKRPRGGRVSPAQVALMDQFERVGDLTAVCKGAEEAIAQLRKWKLIV